MRSPDPHAILVVDLAFGDCGKGTIVDFLVRRYANQTPLVVRFNGGPQAGHNVVTTDGRHHTFSQFGSGTFVRGVETLLCHDVLIEPYALLNEAAHLRALDVADALNRLMIDARCAVITPAHQAANRLRELLRGDSAHGTCGLGIGEAMQDQSERPQMGLYAKDLADACIVAARLDRLCELKLQELAPMAESLRDDQRAQDALKTLRDRSWIDAAVENYSAVAHRIRVVSGRDSARIIAAREKVIFEGAQGVLLDETFGFHPHTTWSTTTFSNAERLLDEAASTGKRMRLGVLRSYFTRHGPGPLVSEERSLRLPEPHNSGGGWQGPFRIGTFDAVAARYALAAVGGVDALAMTHLDVLPQLPSYFCSQYRSDAPIDTSQFLRRRGVVTDIRLHRNIHIDSRRSLTQMLKYCRPVHAPLTTEVEAFIAAIGSALDGSPVAIRSCGPTARDKTVHFSTL